MAYLRLKARHHHLDYDIQDNKGDHIGLTTWIVSEGCQRIASTRFELFKNFYDLEEGLLEVYRRWEKEIRSNNGIYSIEEK